MHLMALRVFIHWMNKLSVLNLYSFTYSYSFQKGSKEIPQRYK